MRLFLVLALCNGLNTSVLAASEPTDTPTQTVSRCSNPKTTDDEKSEIIGLSLQSAVECMGSDWVYGGNIALIRRPMNGQLEIDVDVAARRVRVRDYEGRVHVFLASPGTPGRDTLTGSFSGPFRTEGPRYTVRSRDKDYYGAAIHGTYAVGQLGRPASHGCVRISVANARYLNSLVRMSNGRRIRLVVHGRVPARAHEMPRRERLHHPAYGHSVVDRYPPVRSTWAIRHQGRRR
jgi:hypothetical protein